MTTSDEERGGRIDESELPEAGNSDARLYPPVEETQAGEDTQGDDDPGQAQSGDASAVREGEDQQAAGE